MLKPLIYALSFFRHFVTHCGVDTVCRACDNPRMWCWRRRHDHEVEKAFARIADALEELETQGAEIMAILDALSAQVDAVVATDAKVLAAITALGANTVNPAEVQALADKLKTANDAVEAVLPPV